MKYIALIAVIAILLLEISGAIPRSSVGGPMTIALVFFIAAAGRRDPRGMVEQAGCARLDREHRRRARRRLGGRQPRQHGFGNDTGAPESGRVARGDATSPALCVVGRHDALRAAGVVDRAADRGPDAMSFWLARRVVAHVGHPRAHSCKMHPGPRHQDPSIGTLDDWSARHPLPEERFPLGAALLLIAGLPLLAGLVPEIEEAGLPMYCRLPGTHPKERPEA